MKRMPIPPPPIDMSPEMRNYMRAVQDYVNVMMHGVNNPMERSVTFSDLVALGLVTESQAQTQAMVKR